MNHFEKTNKKLNKLRGIFFQLGLVIACGLSLLAFEWTFPIHIAELGGTIIDEIEQDFDYVEPFDIEDEKEKEKTEEETKSKTDEFEKVEDDYKEPEEEKKEEKTPEKQEEFKGAEWAPVEEVKEEDPIAFAQYMPHYKGCESLNEEERKECTQEKMYQHFSKNIKIPRNIKIRGKATYLAFVYFEVNKKGAISNVRILNDEKHSIPKELERQAYNAVNSLPQLIPAKNRGKKVKVLYKVPIKFSIQ